jgi:hypothetical protein
MAEWNVAGRKPFFRTGAFYGGIVVGIILLPLLLFLFGAILANRSAPAPQQATSGNITITLNDDLLTTGMQLALKKALTQLPPLPFAVTNVKAATHAGDDIELSANLGPTDMKVSFAPTVTADGNLDFKITHTEVAGGFIDLDAFNGVFEAALNDQFSDAGSGRLVKGLDYQLQSVHTIDGSLILNAKLYEPGQK